MIQKIPDIIDDPVWYPYTTIPIFGPREKLAHACGQYVYLENGHRVFDAVSSWWCTIHGHSHPRLVAALRRQAESLDHVLMAPHAHEPAQQLATLLLNIMGKPYKKVFYSDNGSTAVEVALKMLLQYWRMRGEDRSEFLSLKNGYHGDTLGTIALSGVALFHDHFKSERATYQTEAPYCYRCPVGLTFPECHLRCLESLKGHLKNNPKQFAGAIIEPLVMGAGGMISYPIEYLKKFVELCREYGVPVIFDEVFTGFGRTGKMFAYQELEQRPDIVCLSKGLTSGMLPLGVTVTSQELFNEFVGGSERAFFHGHTFTGNPLTCAVALESLKIFEEERTLDKNRELIRVLSCQRERFEVLPLVGNVRHKGMIWALELVTDKVRKTLPEPANALGWRICEKMWAKGFWLRPLHQNLYVIPPYCSTSKDLEECFSALEECLTTRNG